MAYYVLDKNLEELKNSIALMLRLLPRLDQKESEKYAKDFVELFKRDLLRVAVTENVPPNKVEYK